MAKQLINPVIAILNASIKAIRDLPDAPPFDGELIRNAMKSAGLPAEFVERAIVESQKKHEATHGDTESKALQVVLSALREAFEDKADKILVIPRKPRTFLTDAQKDEAMQMRRAGKQKSEIAKHFNVSEGTIFSLTKGIEPVAKV